ncbi:MAG: PEGA domain-containing protein [Candidatus Margulisiibacteriota bacterium]
MKKFLLIVLFSVSVVLSANADYGNLEIFTIPTTESAVYLDNIAVGSTPLKLEKIGVGTHRLEVLINNKSIFDKEIEVKASVTRILVKIEPESPSEKIKLYESQGFGGDMETIFSSKMSSSEAVNLSHHIAGISIEANANQIATAENEVIIPAEPYLKSYVEKQREINNSLVNAVIGLGALSLYYGNTLSGNPEANKGSIRNGAIYMYAGLMMKFFKPEYENKYDKVLAIDDSNSEGKDRREKLASETLKESSADAKNARNMSVVVGPLLGIFYLIDAPIIGIPLIYYAWHVYNNKSEAEIAYDAYLKAIENKKGAVRKN